jgi:hypothetical protein
MKYHIRPTGDRGLAGRLVAKIAHYRFARAAKAVGTTRCHDVEQSKTIDLLATERLIPGQPRNKLASNHTGRAGD